MMKLNDTVAMMNSEDYQERFKAEYYQLKEREDKLYAMLEKYKAGTLKFTPKCSYELLYEQFVYMRAYRWMLEHRAKVEGVHLKTEE